MEDDVDDESVEEAIVEVTELPDPETKVELYLLAVTVAFNNPVDALLEGEFVEAIDDSRETEVTEEPSCVEEVPVRPRRTAPCTSRLDRTGLATEYLR